MEKRIPVRVKAKRLENEEKELNEALNLIKERTSYRNVDEESEESKDFYKKWNFHYQECWNLDVEIACFILPRLIHLKYTDNGCPGVFEYMEQLREDEPIFKKPEFEGLESYECWKKVLSIMIDFFKTYISRAINDDISGEIGWQLFCSFFTNLWT